MSLISLSRLADWFHSLTWDVVDYIGEIDSDIREIIDFIDYEDKPFLDCDK